MSFEDGNYYGGYNGCVACNQDPCTCNTVWTPKGLMPKAEPASPATQSAATFQARVDTWLLACFGEEIARNKEERNHRFLEESLELVQSLGCTKSEALQLVEYVYNRPVGVPPQEVGGVMTTLAALCLANGMDMHTIADTELASNWTRIEKIRAKQKAKPKHSPLADSPAIPATQSAKPLSQDTLRNNNG